MIYLAGHNRPPHEVLFGNDKDIAGEYERAFVGMTEVDCSWRHCSTLAPGCGASCRSA